MDAFDDYSTALVDLQSLPQLLQQRISAIESAERSRSVDLEREEQQATNSVGESQRFVSGILNDAREVLTVIDYAHKVSGAMRSNTAESGDLSHLRAGVVQAGAGLRSAVIDEQHRRRDQAARERAAAAEAERQRLEAERQRLEKLERDRILAEKRARLRALAMKAAAVFLAIIAVLILLALAL